MIPTFKCQLRIIIVILTIHTTNKLKWKRVNIFINGILLILMIERLRHKINLMKQNKNPKLIANNEGKVYKMTK